MSGILCLLSPLLSRCGSPGRLYRHRIARLREHSLEVYHSSDCAICFFSIEFDVEPSVTHHTSDQHLQPSNRVWLVALCDLQYHTVPVVRLFSYPSSIYCVRFSSWLVYDCPALDPVCSLITVCSVIGFRRFRIIRSSNVYV